MELRDPNHIFFQLQFLYIQNIEEIDNKHNISTLKNDRDVKLFFCCVLFFMKLSEHQIKLTEI